jgi:pimeloyl-ACP methyl ester carboxylesterase
MKNLILMIVLILSATAADAACVDGVQGSGALYRICVPAAWNGDLVAYAHGYVAPGEPLRIPDDEVEGRRLSEIVTDLGYAFATTSYSKNGLAIKEGIEDVVDLLYIFASFNRQPRFTYLVGASEGGLVTSLTIEKFPRLISGGLPTCGPIGDFRQQINYFGDFRVVFDYFFPNVLPPDPTRIPQEVMDNWNTTYVPRIRASLQANPNAVRQLLRVTQAPIDPADPASVEATVLGLLWYNVFATNDAVATLGGQPFDNTRRIYLGSDNDLLLNRGVRRASADARALREIEANYQTTGRLAAPVVTLHTTGDPIVPFAQNTRYTAKVQASRATQLLTPIPVVRYGHCNFTAPEVLSAFGLLVSRVSGQIPVSTNERE